MKQIILSPYTFLFEDNNSQYVFNSESLFFSEIDKGTFIALSEHNFSSFEKASIDILLQKKIIIYEKDKSTCFNHLRTRHLTSAYSDDTMVLIIAPTTACNFACPYCFEPKKNPKYISNKVENKLIEYINKQEQIKNISLTWYGGEPLLASEAIKRIYNRIVSETEKTVTGHEIISNTYLVNDDIIELMRECKIRKIQVSIDGIQKNHDKTRFLKSNKAPTFNVIEKNIENIAKALPDMHISIRVNINKNNWMDYVALYFKYHGEEWHKNINLYPGFIREDSADRCTLRYNCYKISDLVDLHLKFAQMGVNVNMFPSNRFKGCMMQRANAFIVGPEGELYKCWDDVSNPDKVIGNIMNNDLYNYDLLMKYMQECTPIRDECKECHVYPVCDGGCGRQQYRNKFENAEFQICSPLKDKVNLKKVLLYSINRDKSSNKKILNFR